METTFLAMLEAQSAITAIVGSGASARIFPLKLPQNVTYPAMTYQVVSGPRDYTQDGADGVTRFRVQLDCFGETYDQTRLLRNAVEASISGLNNEAFGSPPVVVKGVFIIAERDRYEQALDGLPGSGPYRKSMDLAFTVDQ